MPHSFHRLLFFFIALIVASGCNYDLNFAKLEKDFLEAEEIHPASNPAQKEEETAEDSKQLELPPVGKTIKLVSWNIQHLGRTKTESDIKQIARILRNYDLVAIQEVVAKDPAGAQAVAKIADELNRMGFKWDYQVSDPTKSSSAYISERYAFLWKPSRVSMVGRAKLDKELEDLCFREPFIGRFRIKGDTTSFYIANYHSRKFSDRPQDEIIHLIHYPTRFSSDKIIIAGDFNADERDPVWSDFYNRGFKCALRNTKTTLKHACKSDIYRNHAIDNFYYTSGILKTDSGAIDFVLHCDSLQAARRLSDHLPVFMEFGIQ